MKRVLIIICMLFSKPLSAYESVYYCTYQNNKCVENSNSIIVPKDAIGGIVRDVAEGEENFIGFIDNFDTTLQFYVDEIDKVWIEIPSPKDKGSYGKHISNEEMITIIRGLTEPYSEYTKQLQLEFKGW